MTGSFFFSDQSDDFFDFCPVGTSQRNTIKGLILVLVTSGQSMVEIDNRLYCLSEGTILSLLPSHLLRTVSYTDDFRCFTLAFLFDFMADFPYAVSALISEKMEQMPLLKLSFAEKECLVEWYTILRSHYVQTEHPSYKEIARSLVFILIAQMNAIYVHCPIKNVITYREELTDGFFRLLHQYFNSHRNPTFYADQLFVTSKYLAKVIRQVTGHTPSYWIGDFTVREAKVQLKSSTLTVTQLSEQLNFSNSSFFARYFKRYTGVTPQEYRLNH